MGLLLVAVEKITNLIDRCAVYEELYLKNGGFQTNAVRNFENALIGLYTAILQFLVRAKKYLSKNVAARAISGATATDQLSLASIEKEQRTVDFEFSVVEAEHRRISHYDINKNVTDQLRMVLDDLDKPLQTIDENVSSIKDHLQEAKRSETLRWLSRIPYRQHHLKAREGRVENTGQWLLEHEKFSSWKQSEKSSTLWLHGIPGAGKTKLASTVIDFLSDQNLDALAYFYCNRGEPERRDPEVILRTLVSQLASSGPDQPLKQCVLDDFERRKRDGFASGLPTIEDSTAMLKELVDSYPQCMIVIDALDECDQTKRGRLLTALSSIASQASSKIRIFLTSRDEHDITRHMRMRDTPNLYITARDNSDDIERFVRIELQRCIEECELLDGEVDDEFRDKICTTLIEGAHGMFLWCSIQIKRLCELSIRSDVEESLGKLPETLEETYASMPVIAKFH
ncbi:hypothetical protein K440DRAFT_671146 [Wilcoxina mikolae CBS 423.85]|nr:hypothetical protein K440DRAFT_671146 [Wilcoxina mikolae CBS 423.85]